jgi:hypothetical protein
MPIHINVAGVWKEVTNVHINVGGVWKECTDVPINVGGVWKTGVHSTGPSVSILANGDFNTRWEAICYAGIRFHSNGAEYEYTASGGVGSAVNTWLTSGSSSDVWVAFTRTSGASSFVGKTNGVRYNLGSIQNFYVTRNVIGTTSITGYFTMYDAASGGNTLDTSSSAFWSAEYDSSGGGCPLCCFTPNTLVTMASGIDMRIADIRDGDKIMGPQGPVDVGEVIVRHDLPIYTLHFEDGKRLELTPDHPVQTARGPASLSRMDYKDIGIPEELQVGDLVFTYEGKFTRLAKITKLRTEPVVYTFSNSLFYANGILVY